MKLTTTTIGSGSRSAALVHGMTASSLHWKEFARLLVDEYDCTVTLVDLRGHGDSPRSEKYHVDDFGKDLVDTLPVGLDYLIGQSLGGRAVMDAAAELQPKHLIALDPGLIASKGFKFAVKYLFWLQLRMPDFLVKKLVLGKHSKAEPVEAVARMREGLSKWDPEVRRGILATIFEKPYTATATAVPSVMVVPEKSIVVPKSLQAELIALGWDIRVMPNVMHEMHVQDPAGVLNLVSDLFAPTNKKKAKA